MSNQSTDLFSTAMYSTPAFSDSSPSPALNVSTSTAPPTFNQDIIAANDIISTTNYAYSFFAALGFLSACFLLYSFIQTYRAQRQLTWLDCLLWTFCGFQLLLLLLSLSAVAHSPHYLKSTRLGCATLFFTINTAFLCSLLLLVLMAYALTFNPPSHTLLRRPCVCVALVLLVSFVISMLLAGLRGPSDNLGSEEICLMDSARNGISYSAAKFCLTFLIPCFLQLGLLIAGRVRQWKSKGRFLSGSEEGPMFLAVTAIMFACQLFYGVVQLRGVRLWERAALTYHEQAFLSVAEFVLFSGSWASLLLVLLMHRPCRENLQGALRQARNCCRSPGRTQTHIIAPQIEIRDTLQDYDP